MRIVSSKPFLVVALCASYAAAVSPLRPWHRRQFAPLPTESADGGGGYVPEAGDGYGFNGPDSTSVVGAPYDAGPYGPYGTTTIQPGFQIGGSGSCSSSNGVMVCTNVAYMSGPTTGWTSTQIVTSPIAAQTAGYTSTEGGGIGPGDTVVIYPGSLTSTSPVAGVTVNTGSPSDAPNLTSTTNTSDNSSGASSKSSGTTSTTSSAPTTTTTNQTKTSSGAEVDAFMFFWIKISGFVVTLLMIL